MNEYKDIDHIKLNYNFNINLYLLNYLVKYYFYLNMTLLMNYSKCINFFNNFYFFNKQIKLILNNIFLF